MGNYINGLLLFFGMVEQPAVDLTNLLTEFVGSASSLELQRAFTLRKGDRRLPLQDDTDPFSLPLERLDYDFFLCDIRMGYATLTDHYPLGSHLILDSFFPLDFFPSLKRKGIGTLAYVLTLTQAVQDRSLTPDCVFFRENRTDDAKRYAKKIDLPFGSVNLGLYLDRLLCYANSRGFELKNPFDTNEYKQVFNSL